MTEKNAQVIRDFFESWSKGEIVQAFHDHIADNARWLNSGLPDCIGKDACLALAEQFAAPFPVIEVEILALAADGDVVLAERLDRLRPAGGGEPIEVEVTGSFRLSEGRIEYWYDYFDPRPFVAAFGG